jgi:hypothetical protein
VIAPEDLVISEMPTETTYFHGRPDGRLFLVREACLMDTT